MRGFRGKRGRNKLSCLEVEGGGGVTKSTKVFKECAC